MPCHKAKGKKKKTCTKRKKVVRRNGKRYYRNRSGFVRLKGNQKPPRKK